MVKFEMSSQTTLCEEESIVVPANNLNSGDNQFDSKDFAKNNNVYSPEKCITTDDEIKFHKKTPAILEKTTESVEKVKEEATSEDEKDESKHPAVCEEAKSENEKDEAETRPDVLVSQTNGESAPLLENEERLERHDPIDASSDLSHDAKESAGAQKADSSSEDPQSFTSDASPYPERKLDEANLRKSIPECPDPFAPDDVGRREVRSGSSTADDGSSSASETADAPSDEASRTMAEQVAADRDRKNPAYIPRTGKFFMHDEREGDDITLEEFETNWAAKKRHEQEQLEKRRGRIRYGFNGDRWGNDKFNEKLQRPKSYDQIISEYGYDIREDGQAARKKYWDGSHKYDDNRRRSRESGDRGARGRRSGGRGRGNFANRQPHPDYKAEPEPGPGHREPSPSQGNRSRQAPEGPPPARATRGRTNACRPRREFRGRPMQDERRARTDGNAVEPDWPKPGEVGRSSEAPRDARGAARRAPAESEAPVSSNAAAPSQPSSAKGSVPTAPPARKTNESSVAHEPKVGPEPVRVKSEPRSPAPEVKNEARSSAAPAQPPAVDTAPSALAKALAGPPSNKRYSAQRRERKNEREVSAPQQRRQPNPTYRPHPLHHNGLPAQNHPAASQPADSQAVQHQQQHQIPISQLPQQQCAALPPQLGYPPLHAGLDFAHPAMATTPSVMPSVMPQPDMAFFGAGHIGATSVHQQYLLNYFPAIPADPNMQFYAQQQAAAAAAAIANGQFAPGAASTSASDGHFPPPDTAGGTVFYPPVAQLTQQQTPERPRRALPIVAPSAGTET